MRGMIATVVYATALALCVSTAPALASSASTLLRRSSLIGPAFNRSDVALSDPSTQRGFRWAGPICEITACKAWYFDSRWNDPGELKGIRIKWCNGRDKFTSLLGAERPHYCQTTVMKPGERVVQVNLQWTSDMMRNVAFRTTRGSVYSWGFPNVTGSSSASLRAPPGTSLAAIYGLEGAPNRRYIARMGAVWR